MSVGGADLNRICDHGLFVTSEHDQLAFRQLVAGGLAGFDRCLVTCRRRARVVGRRDDELAVAVSSVEIGDSVLGARVETPALQGLHSLFTGLRVPDGENASGGGNGDLGNRVHGSSPYGWVCFLHLNDAPAFVRWTEHATKPELAL